MDFNLPDIDTNDASKDGVFVPIRRPDGAVLTNQNKDVVRVKVCGIDSDRYRKAFREQTRRRLKRIEEGKLTEEELVEAARQDSIYLVAECTLDWEGVIDSKGKAVPFSLDAALVFYGRYPIAHEQADRAIANRALFTKASKGD